jgi:hypothetical protein
MNPEGSASPVDLLFSKFQAVDHLWKDIREAHDGTHKPRRAPARLTTPAARSASSSRRPPSRDRNRFSSAASDDYETKQSLLSPLLSADTPVTAADSSGCSVDGDISSTTASPMEPPSNPHDDDRRYRRRRDDSVLSGDGNRVGARRRILSDGSHDDTSPTSRQRRRTQSSDEHDDDENDAPVAPWYSNPMQVSAMISNFSTSYVRSYGSDNGSSSAF